MLVKVVALLALSQSPFASSEAQAMVDGRFARPTERRSMPKEGILVGAPALRAAL